MAHSDSLTFQVQDSMKKKTQQVALGGVVANLLDA